MPSKFEQMRHRENRKMRANFYATNHATHMSNQKINNNVGSLQEGISHRLLINRSMGNH